MVPFVDSHNTIFFENVEQLNAAAIERIVSLIKTTTNVRNHNQQIFTYDNNKAAGSSDFQPTGKPIKLWENLCTSDSGTKKWIKYHHDIAFE